MCLSSPTNERPPLPADEQERLAALRRHALLDTPPEAAFDRLASLAARLFGVPLAFVTLMDRDRLWFKSCQGPCHAAVGFNELSRDLSFCAHTILSPTILVVEDVSLDPRFAHLPLVVGESRVRFYAGMPLINAEGHALGALCLLDFQPRVFSDDQRAALADLAASVVSEMELRRSSAALAESERLYRQMFEDSPQPMWIFDDETLRFLAVNEAALAHYGYTRAEFLTMTLADIRLPEDTAGPHEIRSACDVGSGDRLLRRHRKKGGTLIWVEATAHTIDYEGRAARMVIASDVTERRRAEEALRRSLTMMKAQQEAALDGILVVDERRQILSHNQRLCEMWGVPEEVSRAGRYEGLLGHFLSLVERPEEYARRVQFLYEQLSERSQEEIELKDGRTFDRYSGPMVSEEGEYYGRVWFFRDITERRRMEQGLCRSEQKRALHIRHTPLAAIEWGLDFEVTAWNPAAEKIFGYTQAEALGRRGPDLILPDAEQAPIEAVRVALLSGTGGTRSTNLNRTKDGREILCEWYNTPLVDDGGRVIGVAALAQDVTEKTLAEAQLRESRQRYKSLVDYHPHTVCSIDAEGNFVAVNAAFEHLTGYSEVEVRGRPFTPLVAPECLEQSRRHYEQTLQGHPQRHELTLRHKTGRRIEARLATVPIVVDGAVLGIYAVVEDITDHKDLEAERESLLVQTESLLADALERADHDPLTGLINHRAFHKHLEEQAEAARREGGALSLLLLDLNDFKFFNDAYGHLAGDDVLRRVASALRPACRAGDTLARFGGDEFALLMPGATAADAARAVGALRDAVARVGYRPPGHDVAIPLSLSAGAASAPQDGAGRVALLGAADARLRVAQSGGDDEGQATRLRRGMTRSVEGFSMLDALVTAVDNKDRYTRRHSEDVMAYGVRIARALGLDARTQHVVEVAALLHDVGKIGVPDAVLRKPGRLTDEEFAAVRQHPMMGSVIVGAVPGFEETLDAVRHHHERWDGEGYPFGLRGEEIPLTARLMAVADAFSAMTTDRPYRKGMEPERGTAPARGGRGDAVGPRLRRRVPGRRWLNAAVERGQGSRVAGGVETPGREAPFGRG